MMIFSYLKAFSNNINNMYFQFYFLKFYYFYMMLDALTKRERNSVFIERPRIGLIAD